jgi:hypothetical protein
MAGTVTSPENRKFSGTEPQVRGAPDPDFLRLAIQDDLSITLDAAHRAALHQLVLDSVYTAYREPAHSLRFRLFPKPDDTPENDRFVVCDEHAVRSGRVEAVEILEVIYTATRKDSPIFYLPTFVELRGEKANEIAAKVLDQLQARTSIPLDDLRVKPLSDRVAEKWKDWTTDFKDAWMDSREGHIRRKLIIAYLLIAGLVPATGYLAVTYHREKQARVENLATKFLDILHSSSHAPEGIRHLVLQERLQTVRKEDFDVLFNSTAKAIDAKSMTRKIEALAKIAEAEASLNFTVPHARRQNKKDILAPLSQKYFHDGFAKLASEIDGTKYPDQQKRCYELRAIYTAK